MIAVAAFLSSAVALAACESRPSLTEPEAPVDEGTTTITSAGLVVHELDYPDPQAVVDYWTAARMRAARPVAPPRALKPPRVEAPTGEDRAGRVEASRRSKPKGETGILTPDEIAGHPHTSIGKVFFTLNGFDHVCSASAVTTEGRWGVGSRDLVVTAGHCLNNGFGVFASNFIFVPGYFHGLEPFGRWPADRLFTTNQWNSGNGAALGRDVGFAQFAEGTGEHTGFELHDVVDALGIIFTEAYREDGLKHAVRPRENTRYASLGYGVLNWGGEDQVRSLGRVVTLDPNFSPSPMGLSSTHTGGASGGPWLYHYKPAKKDKDGKHASSHNLINSVNSYVYGGIDEMYGPQFDDLIHRLWMFAATQ